MFTTALPRCTLFVLVLSQNVIGGKLPPNNIEEISTTPSLLSTTTSTSDNVESGKLLAKGNLEGHCRTLRTLRNSFRKLVNESCKSETNVTRGKKSRRERLPENCVQFTKEYIRPCIQDDRLDEECMEAILNRRDALTKGCVCEGLQEIRQELNKTSQLICPSKISSNIKRNGGSGKDSSESDRMPRIRNDIGRLRSLQYQPQYQSQYQHPDYYYQDYHYNDNYDYCYDYYYGQYPCGDDSLSLNINLF